MKLHILHAPPVNADVVPFYDNTHMLLAENRPETVQSGTLSANISGVSAALRPAEA